MKIAQARRFMVVRHDNLGDVALALPMAGLLKRHFPDCIVQFAVRKYALDVVRASRHVDDVLVLENDVQFRQELVRMKPDAIFFAFPSKSLCRAAKLAGVPFRVGTSRRWFHWLWCNVRPKLVRKNSRLHEAQLNLQLLRPLIAEVDLPLDQVWPLAGLDARDPATKGARSVQWPLRPGVFNLLLQMLSNGHAVEWPQSCFRELVTRLDPRHFNVIINGTAREGAQIEAAAPGLLGLPQVTNATSGFSIADLMTSLRQIDGVIAASTGPLHLAALSGSPTLGLFVDRPALSASRWGPLGPACQVIQADRAICKQCDPGKEACACMNSITVDRVHDVVMHWASAT